MLKRFGKSLVGAVVNYKALDKMDVKKYIELLREDVRQKKVFVVDEEGWSEWFLSEWFKKNYSLMGFNEICEERTERYMKLKQQSSFYGFPDFLAFKGKKVFRVELECFSSLFKYMHSPNYCEVVLCYEIDEPIPDKEVYSLKDILGYENIINKLELGEYLYLTNADFQSEMKEITMEECYDKIH